MAPVPFPASSAHLPPRLGPHPGVHITWIAAAITQPQPLPEGLRAGLPPAQHPLHSRAQQSYRLSAYENESLVIIYMEILSKQIRVARTERKIIKGGGGEMLTLLLLKCCKAFSLWFFFLPVTPTRGGVGGKSAGPII